MDSNVISVFLRFRPQRSNKSIVSSSSIRIDQSQENTTVTTELQARKQKVFTFTDVFGPTTEQELVFSRIGLPAVERLFRGYNATVFAYGQTGSGKTYTITGGLRQYSQRGVIPRCIATIFSEISRRTDCQFEVQVSYLELYNEVVYDLLDVNAEADTIEELSKVTILTKSNGDVEFINLNKHSVRCEEQALNFFFLGDTNRTIAETPMNPTSSRSHCVFTMYLTSMSNEGNRITKRSKLNLVDLAGSERISKTGGGSHARKTEAIHINKELHFLEQVIVSLQKRQKYIPYRNSKLTQILRDSLGGNSITTMIATASFELDSFGETVSTLSFAQRVACIRNRAMANVHEDPRAEVMRLRREIELLKISLLKSEGKVDTTNAGFIGVADDSLPIDGIIKETGEVDPARCGEIVAAYIDEPSADSFLVLKDPRVTTECFRQVKEYITEIRKHITPTTEEYSEKIRVLRERLKQRDREVSVLVNMMNSVKSEQTPIPEITKSISSLKKPESPATKKLTLLPEKKEQYEPTIQELFNDFRKGHTENEALVENTTILKTLLETARRTNENVNESKMKIKTYRGRIESLRIEENFEHEDRTSGEKELIKLIQEETLKLRKLSSSLLEIKGQCKTVQSLITNQRAQIKSDFELWYNLMHGSAKKTDPNPSKNEKESVFSEELSSSLTGVPEADEEIIEFFSLIKKKQNKALSRQTTPSSFSNKKL